MKRIAVLLMIALLLFTMNSFAESPSFQNGDSGAGVKAIQKTLVALNYLSEEYITGDYDDMTELAILAFQIDHSIDPTGIADSDTQHAISDALRSMLGGNSSEKKESVDVPQVQEDNQTAIEDDNVMPESIEESVENVSTPEPIEESAENVSTPEPIDKKEAPVESPKPDIEVIKESLRIRDRDQYSNNIPAYYVAILRNNTDTPISISQLSVDFEDAQGSLVLTQGMLSIFPSVIMPGENGYICERISTYDNEGFDPHTIADAFLHYETKSHPGYEYQDITATDVLITDEGMWKKVTCRIQNNTNFELDSQIIAAVLFDSNGKFLTVCYSYESIKPNEKKGFELVDMTMDKDININGATAKIYVYDSYIR